MPTRTATTTAAAGVPPSSPPPPPPPSSSWLCGLIGVGGVALPAEPTPVLPLRVLVAGSGSVGGGSVWLPSSVAIDPPAVPGVPTEVLAWGLVPGLVVWLVGLVFVLW